MQLQSWKCIAVLTLVFTSQAAAWSYKEHVLLTRLAVRELLEDEITPQEMKHWLRQATPDLRDLESEKEFFLHSRLGISKEGVLGLSYWSLIPDERALKDPRESKVEPFGVHERMLHFVDLELLASGEEKRGYRHDLSGRPPIENIPREMSDPRYIQAGMLPFRVEHCFDQLVYALREGRMLSERHPPDEQDDSAQRWAGYLAHYVADNTQPHHSTVDYRSQSYFNNRRGAPNIHNEMEWRMVDDEKEGFPDLRRDFWPLLMRAMEEVTDPVTTRDPWQATMEVAYLSYEALPLIGDAAVAASTDDPFDTEKFFRHRGQLRGQSISVMEMKAQQQALAVKRIKSMWLAAWEQARGADLRD
jgi:hypothetical protein